MQPSPQAWLEIFLPHLIQPTSGVIRTNRRLRMGRYNQHFMEQVAAFNTDLQSMVFTELSLLTSTCRAAAANEQSA